MSSRLGVGLAALLALAACSASNEPSHPAPDASRTPDAPGGTPDAPQGACANLVGRWAVQGSCGADLCTIAQAGCAITSLTCDSGAHSTSGSLSGQQFMYSGVSGTGAPSTCNGTIANNTFAGECAVVGIPCQFTGTRL